MYSGNEKGAQLEREPFSKKLEWECAPFCDMEPEREQEILSSLMLC